MHTLGFAVIVMIILAVTALTSSDRDGRDRYNRYDDMWYYPSYPPPPWPYYHWFRLRGWFSAFFIGVLVACLIIGGLMINRFIKHDLCTTDTTNLMPYKPFTVPDYYSNDHDSDSNHSKGGIDTGIEKDEEDQPRSDTYVTPPPMPERLANSIQIINVAEVSETDFPKLKEEYRHLPIEGFWDNGRVYAVIFARNSQEKQHWINLVNNEYGTSKNFSLCIRNLQASQLCNSIIVKRQGSRYWTCEN